MIVPTKFDCGETEIPRQGYGCKPELRRDIIAIYMYVSPLVWLMTVEVEPIRAASKNGRHGRIVPNYVRLWVMC